jgi:hypothetical protein
LASDAQFAVKLSEPFRIGRDAGREEFQGDRMVQCQVVGAIHFAHPAAAEHRDEAIAPGNQGSGRETVCWRRGSIARCGRRRARRRHRGVKRQILVFGLRHVAILLEDGK